MIIFVEYSSWQIPNVPNKATENSLSKFQKVSCLTLVLRLGVKKAPAKFLSQWKISVQHWVLPFRDFSWIWSGYKMQQSGRANRCTGSYLTSNTCDFFEIDEILWSYWLIGLWQNRSKIRIVVIQVTKSLTPDNSEVKESVLKWLRQRPTTGNSNMAA